MSSSFSNILNPPYSTSAFFHSFSNSASTSSGDTILRFSLDDGLESISVFSNIGSNLRNGSNDGKLMILVESCQFFQKSWSWKTKYGGLYMPLNFFPHKLIRPWKKLFYFVLTGNLSVKRGLIDNLSVRRGLTGNLSVRRGLINNFSVRRGLTDNLSVRRRLTDNLSVRRGLQICQLEGL